MKTDKDKRAFKRHGHVADIAFSYFNKKHCYNAETINICPGGMCFKSNLRLQPGATVCIRLKRTHPDGSGSGFSEGIHSVALSEVKWCREMPAATDLPYSVGVKYFNPVY
jgi:hypothetical protein